MDKVMPTAPISDVHLNQKELLARVRQEPVVLMSRSQPAAVLVDVENWNRMKRDMDLMLSLIQETRPWFRLPLYTLDEVFENIGVKRDEQGKLVAPNQESLKGTSDEAVALGD
ncbi:MAG: type II toxin-antitoxin system prevent-host-death family antitoxin [Chloroflexota bacterium]